MSSTPKQTKKKAAKKASKKVAKKSAAQVVLGVGSGRLHDMRQTLQAQRHACSQAVCVRCIWRAEDRPHHRECRAGREAEAVVCARACA